MLHAARDSTARRAGDAQDGMRVRAVVEDKQSRRLVGVVTERDMCHSVAADDRRASEVPVEEIMPSGVLLLRPG